MENLRRNLEKAFVLARSPDVHFGATFSPTSGKITLREAESLKLKNLPSKDGFIFFEQDGGLLAIERKGEAYQSFRVNGPLICPAVHHNLLLAQANYLSACVEYALDNPAGAMKRMEESFNLLGGRFIIQIQSGLAHNAMVSSIDLLSGVAKFKDGFNKITLAGADSLSQQRRFDAWTDGQPRFSCPDIKAYVALFDATRGLRLSAASMHAAFSNELMAADEGPSAQESLRLFGTRPDAGKISFDPYNLAVKAEYASLSQAFWLLHSALAGEGQGAPKSIL